MSIQRAVILRLQQALELSALVKFKVLEVADIQRRGRFKAYGVVFVPLPVFAHDGICLRRREVALVAGVETGILAFVVLHKKACARGDVEAWAQSRDVGVLGDEKGDA